ncbi:MAG: CHRD domain-containing protein [Armatimonadetes bacterium]|nr:CHRD domain-containing protein [Armatimonadota bacterium]
MAHQLFYAGTFSGSQENPASGSLGTGGALVIIDLDLATMRLRGNFSGLTGNTTASHIHVAATAGLNGGVATQTPSFSGFPLGVKSGVYDHTFDMSLASSYNPAYITANGGTVGTALQAFLLGLAEGRAYWNIHSTTTTSGEIRANLTAVPEPSSVAVIGMGAVALLARRRKV